LVLEPQILLVDEPSSGLDRITASEIDELLLEQKQHTTLLIVTHDVHGARRVGDRFAVLDQGNLAALGTPDELKNHQNEIVRKLVTTEE
jgi:phospholipid/cholesterol/gamma-HCH transport system ATP-binding protein